MAIINNYPSEAVRNGYEGRVGVRVIVMADGRVSDCVATRSSGYAVLDEAACQGMQRYARFNPALDREGNPTVASWSTSIIYAMN